MLYDAANEYEPYKLAHYMIELAKSFHSYYQTNKVIENDLVNPTRFETIQVVQQIIKDCAKILGISTPEKM